MQLLMIEPQAASLIQISCNLLTWLKKRMSLSTIFCLHWELTPVTARHLSHMHGSLLLAASLESFP